MIIGVKAAASGDKISPYKARLEYIEGTGTQYINTGYQISPEDTVEFKISFSVIEYDADTCRFIGLVQRPYGMVYQVSLASGLGLVLQWFATGGADVRVSERKNVFYRFVADADNRRSTIYNASDVQLATTSVGSYWPTGTAPYPLTLFKRYDKTTCFKGKCAYFEIKDKHRYIPVLDWSDVACMYDEVTGSFLYNQGSGEFSAGPVL